MDFGAHGLPVDLGWGQLEGLKGRFSKVKGHLGPLTGVEVPHSLCAFENLPLKLQNHIQSRTCREQKLHRTGGVVASKKKKGGSVLKVGSCACLKLWPQAE